MRVIGNITQVRLCAGRTPLQTMLRLQQVAGQVVQTVPGDISGYLTIFDMFQYVIYRDILCTFDKNDEYFILCICTIQL